MPSKKLNKSQPDLLLATMQHDKKKAKGVVKFALPVTLGEVIEGLEKILKEI